MMQSAAQNEDDLVTLVFMLLGGLGTGMFSFGVLLVPVREWMVQYHLLATGEQIVISFAEGIGFGWTQILVAVGLLVVLIGVAMWFRRRARERV